MEIKPLWDRVLVKRTASETKTAGGIIIPDTAKEKPMEGVVISTGNGRVSNEGKTISLTVKAGDKILFSKYAGTEVKISNEDHIIMKEDVFVNVVTEALDAVTDNDWLLTLGITPSRPDTGYGYIQYNGDQAYAKNNDIKKVKTFTEKPELEMAKQFLESGDFLWNAGIFIWSLKSIMAAFENHLPEIDSLFKAGIGKYSTDSEHAFINETYSVCPNISIDYGVMEKAENVHVYRADFGWSDLGTWGSLYEIREKDDNNNAIVGKNVMTYDSSNCIVNVPKNKLVVIQGLDDYIIAEEDHSLLICRKQDEQMIRNIVNDIRIEKGEHYT